MTTSEPTTGEIVEALRDEEVCQDVYWCDKAADRLESQERENATMRGDGFDATSVTNVLEYLDTVMGLIHCADGIKDLIVSMQGTEEELIARAESAEARERAAVEEIYKIAACDACKRYDPDENDCAKPMADSHKCFEWRGPQAEKGDAE